MAVAPLRPSGPPDSPAQAFFHAAEATFERASRAGVVSRDLLLAGRRIRLEFAGEALLRPLTRALAHLLVAPKGEGDLTVLLWDRASTGVAAPPPPWGVDAYTVRSEIAGYNTDDFHTTFQTDTQSLLLFDGARMRAIYWTADAARLPTYDQAAPLRSILHWWSRRRAMQMVHGAVLAGEDGCVLLAGPSGAGKSSTALACLPSPLRFLSDDYSLLQFEPEPRIHCVYSVAKVGAADVDRMPHLRPMISNRWEVGREKAVFFLHEEAPEKLVGSARLRAIVLPDRCGGRDSALEPVSAAAALVALGASTHVQLPNAGEEVLRRLLPVVRSLPCLRLRLGTDVAQLAPLLVGLLRSLGRSPAS